MEKDINNSLVKQIVTLGRILKSHALRDGNSLHLTFLQVETLFALKTKGNLSMKQVSEMFHITMPTATVLVDKLLEMKLVSRKNDTEDRRVVYVSLTQKGNTLLESGMKKREENLSMMLDSITSEDKKSMIRILEKMIARAQEMYEK